MARYVFRYGVPVELAPDGSLTPGRASLRAKRPRSPRVELADLPSSRSAVTLAECADLLGVEASEAEAVLRAASVPRHVAFDAEAVRALAARRA
jgi:hypothetical protein